METLTAIFGHLCGQGRPFVIDGAPLPVCQRCLGLYAGAAMTAAWLLASGVWRRGLPDRCILCVHLAMLGRGTRIAVKSLVRTVLDRRSRQPALYSRRPSWYDQ